MGGIEVATRIGRPKEETGRRHNRKSARTRVMESRLRVLQIARKSRIQNLTSDGFSREPLRRRCVSCALVGSTRGCRPPILRTELVHAGCVPDPAGSCTSSSMANLAPRWHWLILTAPERDLHPGSGAVLLRPRSRDGILSPNGGRRIGPAAPPTGPRGPRRRSRDRGALPDSDPVDDDRRHARHRSGRCRDRGRLRPQAVLWFA